MKKFAFLSLTLLAIFAFFTANIQAQEKNNKKTAEVLFSVNIDCKNCVKKLEAKLPFEEGVKDLKISLEDKTIWFAYLPEKTDKVKLAKAIEKLGYKAEEIVQENKTQK
jgi:copper chaperone CopZ